MRFKKGSKVEVLSKKELPSGAWRTAEIISGNGHYYSVRYHNPLNYMGGAMVERVSRKVIRPCPPVSVSENWAAGDIVEIFDNNSWKISKVLRPLGGSCFFVKLIGSSQEIKVHKLDIRMRLSWQGDQWIVTGQNSRSCENREMSERPKYYLKTNCELLQQDVDVNAIVRHDHFFMENVIGITQRASSRSSKTKRRSEFCSSHVETQMEAVWKKRAIEKEGRRQQVDSWHPSQLQKKVDAVASPRIMLGENYMHASFSNRMAGFSETGMTKNKLNVSERFFTPTSSEPNDAESSACCSVASCGSSYCVPYMLSRHSIRDPSLGVDCQFDDAESSSVRECERRCSFPTEEEWAGEIRKLELHAYRSTMEALYASGTLTWEQEEMMTNLRLNLHISNDEHLLELRHLVSS